MDAETAPKTLAGARREAAACTRCDLYRNATQTVFGEGPGKAPVMLVGEQPGDREDIDGHPFVGPAGQMLARAMDEAGLARSAVYLTNAVKHFKNEPRGKRRLHRKPNAGEIDICRWWLDQERRFVAPRLIVAMGGSALRGVVGRTVTVKSLRGRVTRLDDGAALIATIHPSYLLRMPDRDRAAAEYRRFVGDLGEAARFLAA